MAERRDKDEDDPAVIAAGAILKLVEELRLQRGMQGRQEVFLEQIRDHLVAIHRTDEDIKKILGDMVEWRRDSERKIALLSTTVKDHEQRLEALENSRATQ